MVTTMKSFSKTTEDLVTALLTVSKNVGQFEPIDATKSHIVWGVDSESSRVSSDNKKEIQGVQGTIDLFAVRADRGMADEIQAALNNAGISFFLNSVQFEDYDLNNFIHYEWVFEVS